MKNKINKISIGLPCYNEEENIKKVIDKILVFTKKKKFKKWELILIDNHSTDKTVEIIKKIIKKNYNLNIKLLINKTNILYSGSVNRIINCSKYQHVAIMDSDNQYDPNDIAKLFKKLQKDNLDLIIGKRSNRQDSIFRKIVSKFFLVISQVLISNNLSDLNCGIRIIKKNLKIKKYITHKLNFCNPEIYMRYKINDLKISETNVSHFNRNNGESIHNITNLFKTILIVILYLLRLSKIKK